MTYAGLAASSVNMQAALDTEMQDGERVVWSGQPVPSRYKKEMKPAVFFGLGFAALGAFFAVIGFTGMGQTASTGPGMEWPPLIFGSLFVLIGLGVCQVPRFAGRIANITIYAVTDLRAIEVISAPPQPKVRSWTPADMTVIERVDYPDGIGDVYFARVRQPGGGGWQRVGFSAVASPAEAEKALRDLLDAQASSPSTPLDSA